ncbi:Glycosyltransferase involved in cell wall bisynthesis [Thermomonospora echinospora]|uniref:Glycosyltransferase involved in cell wall bisynthesis n=1 Tax=Thermomonospora echinospora TaxID=1992 RepID=A0A1H6C8F5_9ACTN|nr:glycosyltransferase family 4 protein [Thermomonospora echinospora]SEG69260.1 Glycosyltransferase involved in cell wall bisynthesis [Thermomonospora echinospora]
MTADMRILWITEHYPPSRGGMTESCDRIVRGLRGAGVEVDVAHLTRRNRPWQVEREHGGRLLTAPLQDDPEHALRRLWTTLTAENLTRGAYTHVVAFGGTYALLAAPVVAALLRAPLVTLLRGNDIDTGIFSMRRRGVLRDALQVSARVCVVAGSHAPLVSALAPDATVTWVANSVDTDNWQVLPSERDRALAWRAEHVAPGRRTIGIIGHLKNKKGVGFLLDALRASGHAEAFHLLLVGEVEDVVQQWLAERSDTVPHSMLPFLDRYELPSVYASCDVVALPSFYDGMPNVALEAAALGIPLLASDAGGLGDIVDEEIGFAFPAGDRHACRAAIDRLARADDEDLAKRGAAAAERIRRDFTPAAETAGYLKVFGEVSGT